MQQSTATLKAMMPSPTSSSVDDLNFMSNKSFKHCESQAFFTEIAEKNLATRLFDSIRGMAEDGYLIIQHRM